MQIRKLTAIVTVLACIAVILSSYVAGPPPGTTNAPGETTCYSSPACHNVSPNIGGGFGEITVMGGVPTGNLYIPGQTYQIMPYVVDTNKLTSGFEVVALLDNGNLGGTANIIMATNTQLVSSGGLEYIMQTSTGAVEPSMLNMHDWMYEWVAPAAGSGTVTFYAAFVAADSNANPSNDNIYIDTLILYEDTTTVSLSDSEHRSTKVLVFPNPASDYIEITLGDTDNYIEEVLLMDLSGKIVFIGTGAGRPVPIIIDTNTLPPGLYFAKISVNKEIQIRKVLIL